MKSDSLISILKMRRMLSKNRLKAIFTLVASSFFVTLIFQNCAEPLQLSEQDASTFSNNVPFAYDVKMDTFAFMSCKPDAADFDMGALFNFRVGAFEPESGLKLSDDFLKATASFSKEGKSDALFRSTTNTGAIMQLAVRNGAVDYQQTQRTQDNGG
ncbi:MAG: hypothetical protein KDD34_06815, partial [Bdellovibrionales bacterium]|nr:hypothetical protein [Bdellovibrionales bacterium]